MLKSTLDKVQTHSKNLTTVRMQPTAFGLQNWPMHSRPSYSATHSDPTHVMTWEYINGSKTVRNLGSVFDESMNLKQHVKDVCKSAFYHIQNISKIRDCLTHNDTETLVHAFISSKLDFCNALLYGLPQCLVDKLQGVQNSAARLVTRTHKYEHITPVLMDLDTVINIQIVEWNDT